MKPASLKSVNYVLFYALLVCLPFTSFPLVSKIFSGTSVAPLSAAFLLLLLILVLIPHIFTRRSLPGQLAPLLIFLAVGVFSTAFSAFLPTPSFRDASVWKNALEAILTLLVGICFYLIVLVLVKDKKTMTISLRWVYAGGVVVIIVSLVQALAWYMLGDYPPFLKEVHAFLTSNGLLYDRRVTGVAYEPSWLANQLNTLYIPLWLGFTVTRFSVFKQRLFKKVSIENILLGFALLVLFLSYSRIGWLTSLAMAAFVIFKAANQRMGAFLAHRAKASKKKDRHISFGLSKLLLWVGLGLLFALLIFLIGLLLTRIDPRMEDLFDLERYRDFGILGWASQLSFAERLIYWISGFKVFLGHPWFGVGMGSLGFYIPQSIPNFGWSLPEIFRVANFESNLLNAKNLWVRLLAETGVIGFSFFAGWVYTHWRQAGQLERGTKNTPRKGFGMAGKLIVIAFLIEGFSMDSFGLPYYWIALGLLAAAAQIDWSEKARMHEE